MGGSEMSQAASWHSLPDLITVTITMHADACTFTDADKHHMLMPDVHVGWLETAWGNVGDHVWTKVFPTVLTSIIYVSKEAVSTDSTVWEDRYCNHQKNGIRFTKKKKKNLLCDVVKKWTDIQTHLQRIHTHTHIPCQSWWTQRESVPPAQRSKLLLRQSWKFDRSLLSSSTPTFLCHLTQRTEGLTQIRPHNSNMWRWLFTYCMIHWSVLWSRCCVLDPCV